MYSNIGDEPLLILPCPDRKQEQELLQKYIDKKIECYNLKGYTGIVSLDEIFKLRGFIENYFNELGRITGSGVEGNGFNVGLKFDKRDWMCEVRVDENNWVEGRRDKGFSERYLNTEKKLKQLKTPNKQLELDFK
tara:strand:- start:1896 stop:2300 length:405 start_codon:yes stop_codon:yes gene_type:complete